ncbi:cytochrome P450 2B4-like [Aplochiton taeniatus]
MLGSLVLYVFVFFLLLFFITIRRPKGFPSGPQPLPLLGNLLELNSTSPLKSLDRLQRHYGNIFSLYIGTRPVVVLNGLEVIREALVTQDVKFSGRPSHMLISHVTEGKGIILADSGSGWKEHRRFALSTLRNFGLGKRSMENRILEEVSHICSEMENSAGTVLFHKAASNIICSLIFGERFDYIDPFFLKLINGIIELTHLAIGPWSMIYEIFPVLRVFPLPFRKAFSNYAEIKEHVQKVVNDHKSSRVVGEPRDLIDSYLDQLDKIPNEGSSMNNTQMVIMLIDLFVAGTDTTSNTLRAALLHLMHNQDIQERCVQEMESVLGGRSQVSFEDRHAMPYVQAVIHEIQRISDAVPLSVFHIINHSTQLLGYQLPKGTMVIPNLSSVLHEEGQWKFPHEFNPENFLNEHGQFEKPEAFIPFSAGSRVCLGESLARMELFLILVTLIRNFRFVWPKDGGKPDFQLIFGITNSAKPYRLGVELRSSLRG